MGNLANIGSKNIAYSWLSVSQYKFRIQQNLLPNQYNAQISISFKS